MTKGSMHYFLEDKTSINLISRYKKEATERIIKLQDEINDISAYKNIFNRRSMIKSSELITADSYSIAVFANEYVPHTLDADAIKFILTVNGIDYDVVPINSNSNGIKVIRFSGGKSNTIYTQLINEKITSAYLSVVFNAQTDATAYVNNIKILIGGEI